MKEKGWGGVEEKGGGVEEKGWGAWRRRVGGLLRGGGETGLLLHGSLSRTRACLPGSWGVLMKLELSSLALENHKLPSQNRINNS